MKNTPDPTRILIGALCSAATLYPLSILVTLIEENGPFVLVYSFGLFLVAFFCVFFVLLMALAEIVFRPKEVEVGDGIILYWRFNRSENWALDSIAYLYLEPERDDRFWTRWTGGSVGFKGRRRGIRLSYKIASTIEQAYFQREGRNPPSPG